MVQDPQLSRLRMSLRQTELNRNAASERRSSYGRTSFSSRKKEVKPAKITECPQNAVEFRRLISTWTELDKAQKKSLSKLNNAQFNLRLEYNELLTGKKSDSGVNLLLPPGFRYHANGEPKRGKSLIQVSHLRDSGKNSERNSSCSVDKVKSVNNNKDFMDEEIKETEIALEEIHADRQLHAISKKISQMKSSIKYLRAHSANDLSSRRGQMVPTKRKEGWVKSKNSSSTKTPQLSQNGVEPGFLRGTVSSDNKRFNSNNWQQKSEKNLHRSPAESSTCSPVVASSISTLGKKSDTKPSISAKLETKSSTTVRRAPPNSAPFLSKRNLDIAKENQISMRTRDKQLTRSSDRMRENNNSQKAQKRLSVDTLKISEDAPTRGTASSKSLNGSKRSTRPSLSTDMDYSDDDHDHDDDTILKVSTEDSYRHMMRRASITDEQKLAKLSEMMEGVAVGSRKKKSSVNCHIRARQSIINHRSSDRLVPEEKHSHSLAALKSKVELETKSSRAKIQDFLQRLPTPDVTIRRWRTSKGDMQIIQSRCEAPSNGEENTETGGETPAGKTPGEEGGDSDSDHASVSTNLSLDESEKSEKLAINTALTSWPTHWAQRAAFFNTQCSPDDGEKDGEKDPEKEYKKLLRCRYLRIPSRMLRRNASVMSTTSSQAWK